LSTGAGSLAILNGTAITTTNKTQGARAELGGALIFNGGSVTAADPGGLNGNRVGLWAVTGGSITANDLSSRRKARAARTACARTIRDR
jgi:hypothetical protein